MTAHEVPNE